MTICPSDDRAQSIRAKYLRTTRRQIMHDRRRWKMIHVPFTDGHECKTRAHRIEKCCRTAGSTSVVTNLQNIGMQIRSCVFEQPFFFRPFCVAHEQHSDLANTHKCDHTR